MRYFVIEGIDTSGKSTQWNLLRKKSSHAYLIDSFLQDSMSTIPPESTVFIQEPSNTPLGNTIRDIILHKQILNNSRAMFLLFLAQRAELLAHCKSLPNIVISDRSLISGISYATDIDIEQALMLNLFATHNILPQKIVFLELSLEALQQRLTQKNTSNTQQQIDNIESKGAAYLYQIQRRLKETLKIITHYAQNNQRQIEICSLDATEPQNILHEEISNFFKIY
ncbi:dTMP kinase [Helicobacter aurati]|uniref:Thymidylate kinase n=1 Tax=Helicobacter aurati TaxID=137778 RepID=A0A3D8J1G6_9HELI|nr:dTMP kinase [Helicobacter aurati]RDU71328.1 dTMP kinase [Helicobacter aurati]